MNSKRQRATNKFDEYMKKRLLVVFFITSFLLLVLFIAIIRINLNNGEDYSRAVNNNYSYETRNIEARRGDIVDRNGIVLACSQRMYYLILDAKVLLYYSDQTTGQSEKRTATVDAICEYFGVERQEIESYLNDEFAKDSTLRSSYKILVKDLYDADVADFRTAMSENKNIVGVWLDNKYTRTYPFGALAAEAVGFWSEENEGELGLEKVYNDLLTGTNGSTYGYMQSGDYVQDTVEAQAGYTIVSTIDYNIQKAIEDSIKEYYAEGNEADSVSVIAMDPNNGEVLGMADYPTFDLSDPRSLTNAYTEEELGLMTDEEKVANLMQIWKNNCVSMIFEPGSVFKTFTIASALEENLVEETDVFTCDGTETYNEAVITCHGGEGHGDLTVTSSLSESCNDALMQIAMLLGKETFCDYEKLLKFGSRTGIDLPGEEYGILIDANSMMDVDLATNSFGQNISVTMIQMISAWCSVVNGGYYYKPHMVREIRNASGSTYKTIGSELVTKTYSSQTSELMQSMLRDVVDYGTGFLMYRSGYSVGAKSGTAEKQPRGTGKYVVSIIAAYPAENPEIVLYVVVDSPKLHDSEEYDSDSTPSQYIGSAIMDKIFSYLNIYPDYDDYETEIHHFVEGDETSDAHLEVVTKREEAPSPEETVEEVPAGDTPVNEIIYRTPKEDETEDETQEGETTAEGEAPIEDEAPAEGEEPAV